VVTVLDTGQTRSRRPYIAMEYFEFGSLRDRVEREGPLPVRDVLRIGIKISGALAAAHEVGILHRDIKPQNILMSRYGEPALADFGVAHLVDTLTMSTHSEALTPLHAAPEILQGGSAAKTCDVYSLGSTLYQLLSGQPAYMRRGDEGLAPLLLRVVSAQLPVIARPDVPAILMDTLREAMAKRPEDRLPDAWAFGAGLQRVQAELGLPVTEMSRNVWSPAFSAEAAEAGAALPDDLTPPSGPSSTARLQQRPELAFRPPADPSMSLAPPGGTAAPPDGGWAEQTLLRADRAEPGQMAGRPERRSRWPLITAGAAVIAAMLAGIGPHLTSHRQAVATPSSPPRVVVPAATRPAPSVVNAARPTGLSVVDGGSSAALHWKLGPDNGLPLLVMWSAAGAAERPAPQPVSNGSTSTTVTGLDPRKGYCFKVGALVAETQPSVTMAWSQPACIRGAQAPK
jgi:hypothetical protein